MAAEDRVRDVEEDLEEEAGTVGNDVKIVVVEDDWRVVMISEGKFWSGMIIMLAFLEKASWLSNVSDEFWNDSQFRF
jgi:hypothetical protein